MTRPTSNPVLDVAKLIDQLGDDDFQVRQSASLRITSLPGSALPAVEAVFDRGGLDPETLGRLEKALTVLRPRALSEEKTRRRDTFLIQTFDAAYQAGGHTDPRWDAAAREAIVAYLRIGRDPRHAPPALRGAATLAIRRALDAGCKDPLVGSLGFIVRGTDLVPALRNAPDQHVIDHRDVQRGNYPPLVKFIEQIGYLWSDPSLISKSDIDEPATLITEVMRAAPLPERTIEPYTGQYLEILERDENVQSHLPPFIKAYAKAHPRSVDPMILEAIANLDEVDESYTQSGTLLQEKLANAEQSLSAAYELAPADARASALMIRALDFHGGGVDEEMDTWFQRAIAAEPDWREPYRARLHYHAKHAEEDFASLLAFGHECMDTQNWRGGVPFFMIEVHELLSRNSPDREAYFRQPAVWRDCAQAYEGGLLNFPDDVHARSAYAKLAMSCGQWLVARRQFQLLGDAPDLSVFISKASYDYLRDKAERLSTAEPPEKRP